MDQLYHGGYGAGLHIPHSHHWVTILLQSPGSDTFSVDHSIVQYAPTKQSQRLNHFQSGDLSAPCLHFQVITRPLGLVIHGISVDMPTCVVFSNAEKSLSAPNEVLVYQRVPCDHVAVRRVERPVITRPTRSVY